MYERKALQTEPVFDYIDYRGGMLGVGLMMFDPFAESHAGDNICMNEHLGCLLSG